MKKVFLYLMAVMMVALSSCGSKNMEDILKTIPKKSGYVAVLNVKNLNDKLKADGDNLADIIEENLEGMGRNDRAEYLLGSDSPIDFSYPIAMFEYKGAAVATFYVKDEGQFRTDMKKQADTKLTERKGIWVSDDNEVFLKDHQAWIASGYPELESADVLKLAGLSEGSSIMSLGCAKSLIDLDADIAVIGNLDQLSQYDRDMIQAMASLQLLFEDPEYVEVFLNFNSGALEGGFSLLNTKGDICKMSVSPAKIDSGKLKDFDGQGNIFFAAGVDSQQMKQVVRQLRALNVLPPEALDLLGKLHGNIVASADATSSTPALDIMLTFNDSKDARECENFLENQLGGEFREADINSDGKNLYISVGNPRGSKIEAVADDFNGATAGVAVTSRLFKEAMPQAAANLLRGASIACMPEGKSPLIKFTLETKEGQNSLVSLIELSKKMNKSPF